MRAALSHLRVRLLVFAVLGVASAGVATTRAHPPDAASPEIHLPGAKYYGGSRLTFGYFNSQSEAEAESLLEAECPVQAQPPGLAPLCVKSGRTGALREILVDSGRLLLWQRVQEAVFEWYVIRRNAFEKPAPSASSIPRPECIAADSDIWQRVSGGFLHFSDRNRVDAVREAYSDQNLTEALLMDERLRAAQARCTPGSEACTSIQQQRNRLRSGYMGLWPKTDLSTGFAMERVGVPELRSAIYRFLGAPRADDDATDRELQALGEERVRNGVRADHYLDYAAFLTSVDHLFTNSSATPAIQAGRRRLAAAMDQFRASLAPASAATFSCLRPLESAPDLAIALNEIGVDHVGFLRQAVLNARPSEREVLMGAICRLGLKQWLDPSDACRGVRRVPGAVPPTTVAVSRSESRETWPFSSQAAFSIEQSASQQRVRMPVQLVVSDESERAQALQLAQAWQRTVNGYFNCHTGGVANPPAELAGLACPPAEPGFVQTPPVRFDVTFSVVVSDEAPEPPSFRLHECFNCDIEGSLAEKSDCEEVRRHRIRQCISRGSSEAVCENSVSKAGSAVNNRENAGNLTFGAAPGVVIHEVGHALGLPDEYTAPPYDRVYNPSGEADSIMRNPDAASRLYPRHLRRILSPLRCVAPPARGPLFMPEEI